MVNKCPLCESEYGYLLAEKYGVCEHCAYHLEQYRQHEAMVEYIQNHRDECKQLVKIAQKQNMCYSCGRLVSDPKTWECNRGANSCPQEYETLPDISEVSGELNDN